MKNIAHSDIGLSRQIGQTQQNHSASDANTGYAYACQCQGRGGPDGYQPDLDRV